MLRAIDIPGGWVRYKTQTPIRPGKYYLLETRKPSDLLKRRLGLVAASNPDGQFLWLAPHESWVKWVLQGLFVEEEHCYGKDFGQHDQWAKEVLGGCFSRLRPYQQRFVLDALCALASGYSYRRAAIIGLGGGKTAIGLSLAAFGERSLVLAPRHVHPTWENEAKKWGLPTPRISTYESAWKLIEEEWDVVVLDEVLRCCNPDTQRSAATKVLSKKAQIVVALTGTPTAGRGPLDWRWLDCVRPGCVPQEETPWRFLFSDHTKVEEKGGRKCYTTPADGWDTERISKWVSPFVYRVDTSELLAHLPPIQFQRITVPLPRDWNVVVKGAATERGTMKRVSQARMLSDGFVYNDQGATVRLDSAKADAIVEFVEGLGEPVVVVARWRESISHLALKLADHRPAVVASESSDVAWQLARFRSGETKVLIISARYGEGIDGLQDVARVLVFCSNGSANDRKQMIGRLYRHGQQRGIVVVDVEAEGSMDARQRQLIDEQTDLAESQIDKILAAEFGLEG